MENYDEKMNYSFEPASPEAPAAPQQPLEQAKEELRRSGKHCVFCAVAYFSYCGNCFSLCIFCAGKTPRKAERLWKIYS